MNSVDVQFEVEIAKKYKNLYTSALSRGIEFSLTLRDMRNFMRRKRCAITGIILTDTNECPPKASKRTIDRIDSKKGYVKDNVIVCCHAANQAKNALVEYERGQMYLGKSGLRKLNSFIEEYFE